jgi:hypothetical protein
MALPRRADRGSYELDDAAQSTPETQTRVKLPPDPYGFSDARPKRGRRPLIIVGAIAVLFVTVALVNRSTHHSSGDNAASGQTGTSATTGTGSNTNGSNGSPVGSATGPVTSPIQGSGLPSGTADSIPIGYPHSAQGAQSAAANYVSAYGSATMVHVDARHRLVNAIADPAIASTLQSQLDATFTAANTSFGLTADGAAPPGQTFVARAAPIGVTLLNDDGNSATVAVWTVSLSGLAGNGSTHPVTEAWSTITVTLHWTQGDWKWVSFTSVDGPVPTSGQQIPSTGQALQNAVNQFGGLRYAR